MEKTTKLLGGWGYVALLVGGFLGFFAGPFAGVVTLGGMVCVLIAFYRSGSELNLPDIKRDITIAIVLNVVAYILIFFFVGAAVMTMVLHHRDSDMGSAAAAALGVGTIFAGFLFWILAIAGTWFWYRASRALADGTGVTTYKTGGLLMFIGAITVVVFGLGFLVIWVGEIVQTVAFFSTPEETPDSLEPPGASAG